MIGDGVLRNSSHSNSCIDRCAFDQGRGYLSQPVSSQSVHGLDDINKYLCVKLNLDLAINLYFSIINC